MANTTAVYARIDKDLKENAENILLRLGISPSAAIQMLYSQVVLNRGLPFENKLPCAAPVAISGLSDKELKDELTKGVKSIKSGEGITADEVDAVLFKELGI